MDSPESPLSDVRTDEFEEEIPQSARTLSASPSFEEPHHRPSKRPRVSGGANRGANRRTSNQPQPPVPTAVAFDVHEEASGVNHIPSDADISSDTDGSVPGSPHLGASGAAAAGDDEGDAPPGGKEQVSVCKWEGCEAGDQGNMDLLVKHLHQEHIHARQKKYSCEWIDCTRKGIAHASGYALRAHMRSHTREKPFYCTLPECDRSFTRSDALAKHMRTVHETEALRPSDPVPKHHSSNPQNKSQRLRLTFKLSANANGKADDEANSPVSSKAGPKDIPLSPTLASLNPADIEYEHNNVTFTRDPDDGDWIAQFPSDVQLSKQELDLPLQQLLVLLHKQMHWAMEIGEDLKQQSNELERQRKAEWIAKEAILSHYIQKDTDMAEHEDADTHIPTVETEENELDGDVTKDEMILDGDEIPRSPLTQAEENDVMITNGDA